MNYSIKINEIVVAKESLSLNICGEIEDSEIANGVLSKPKLILLFENEKEDRRIPFVFEDVSYIGTKCVFSGVYEYRLDMLFWKSRALNLPFKLNFALSYGNEYIEDVKVQFCDILCDDETPMYIAKVESAKAMSIIPQTSAKKKELIITRLFKKLVSAVFKLIMLVFAICLIPFFFLEAILAFFGCATLCVIYDGRVIGAIIGHVNRKFERVCGIKINIARIKRVSIRMIFALFKKCFKLKNNRITFISARRTDISGNFLFVYEEMKSRPDFDSLDVRFVLNDKTIRQLNIIDILKFCKACATSKVIVLDEFTPQIHYIDLRKGTKLVQLWHACGAFKTFGFTRLGKPKGSPQPTRNHRNYDYVTVSSEYCKRCHSEGFGIPYNNVVPTGIPRTDVFFDEQYKKIARDKFYQEYPQFKDKRIIMFAPTFRGTVKETAFYPFDRFDVEKVINNIPEDYVIIVKHHPFIQNPHPIPEHLSDRVIDLSSSTEINDLLFISDLIITDYSSLVFEASLLKIPMLFYVYDLNEYIRDRDFYFDLRLNSPGKLVFDLDELINTINEQDYQTDRIEAFKNMFFDKLDGKSTERVANLILNELN